MAQQMIVLEQGQALQLAGRIESAMRDLSGVSVESARDRIELNMAIELLAELQMLVERRTTEANQNDAG